MANIPISALPNVQPSGYTPNDLLVIVNSGTTSNTSLSAITSYVLSAFTGNTSATCISDLYVTNVHGCSPITIHDSVQSVGSQSTGTTSFAFGDNVSAFGNYSHAEGQSTQSIGSVSHAEGRGTQSIGGASHSEGFQTQSIGDYSHAEGINTISSGTSSHAEGSQTKSIGNYSHSEGESTQSLGNFSHAEGESTQSVGESSHAEGAGTISSGNYSHAEGAGTIASGLFSHAEGNITQAIGSYSHAEGLSTIASGAYQHVSGKFNESGDTTAAAFIIGNGINNSSRSNLLFAAGNEVNISGKTITTNFQMTSGATNGYILTSDSLGNGFWQSITASGGLVTGLTFNNGTYDLTVNTNAGDFTQSLYILAGDMTVTGGTYNPGNGTATFTTNSGGTFNVSGFLTGYTDTNIYTVDGSLTGNRLVDLSGYTLTFNDDIIVNTVYVGSGNGTGSNISIGDISTLSSNATGYDNIAIGNSSLSLNTFGASNTSVGSNSLLSNTSGSDNTSLGFRSLYNNFQGSSNTSLGSLALYLNTNGFNNTSVGFQAGYDIQTGSNNTIVGSSTGGGLISGSFNTIIGANVIGLSSSLSNNIIISDGQGNRRINVDNTGNVGIGTLVPSEKLEVSGKTKTTNFQMTSGATNNYILKSDSLGNGSWDSLTNVLGYTPVNTTGDTMSGLLQFTGSGHAGIRLNNLTTIQRNAIVSPQPGMSVYDTNLNTTCNYNGTFWVYDLSKLVTSNVLTTSTGATSITGLTFSVESGSTYMIEGYYGISCSGTGGVKFTQTTPTGTTMEVTYDGIGATSVTSVKIRSFASGVLTTTSINNAATSSSVIVRGFIKTSTTSGTLQFQYASTTNGQTSTLKSSSWLKITKIS